jgi:pimeloyl-ACP methyl ester carboxylesterase
MLVQRGLTRGWLVAESFSSQVAWALVAPKVCARGNATGISAGADPSIFVAQGLILAGGFVRHPLPFAVWLGYHFSRRIPMWMLHTLCELWAGFVTRRGDNSAEVTAGLREFVVRRTNELDRAAITRRYRIILENDLRLVARHTSLPTFLLTGGFDPIVPWPWVRPWVRRHCPGYRDSRIIRHAGHAVLLDAPVESARQILDWIAEGGEASTTPSPNVVATPVR